VRNGSYRPGGDIDTDCGLEKNIGKRERVKGSALEEGLKKEKTAK